MEPAKKVENEILDVIKMRVEEATANKANSEELTTLRNELDNHVKSIKDWNEMSSDLKEAVETLGLKFEKISEIPKSDKEKAEKSFGEMMDENKDRIAAFKSGSLPKLTLKATHAASDINTGADFAAMMPGIGQIPQASNFMKDLIEIKPISSEYMKYVDQNSIVRDAKNVAGCDASTHLTKATWVTNTIQIEKVRDLTKICTDMLTDYTWVQGEINSLLSGSLQAKINSQLLVGTGVSPELTGLVNIASSFVAANPDADVSGIIPVPTIINLIDAVRSQIMQLGQMNAWTPNAVIMSHKDALIMRNTKDANNRPLLESLNGLRVIENSLIAANTMYVGDFKKATIYRAKEAEIEFSYHNDTDFEQDLATMKAYERLQLHVRNVDANAFTFVPSIATALTDITKS